MTADASAKAQRYFWHRVRVRYGEIDSQAVLFNARYLDYADIAITEYFRRLGISFASGPETPEFHVAKATVEYKAPIRYDEEIDLTVRTLKLGRSSLTLNIEFRGAGEEGLRATVEEIYVHVDLKSGKSAPLPDWVRAAIEAVEGLSDSRL
jgi:acyl-CoA thioester hydrolase